MPKEKKKSLLYYEMIRAGYPAIISYIALDTFDDVDDTNLDAHTPNVGGPWAEEGSGDFSIVSNEVRILNIGANSRARVPVPEDAYTINLDVTAGVNTGFDAWGILFGYVDPSHFYRFNINITDSEAQLVKQNGTDIDLDIAALTVVPSTVYALQLVKNGSSITATVGDITLTATDSEIAGLTAGIYSYIDAANPGVRFDNFSVT